MNILILSACMFKAYIALLLYLGWNISACVCTTAGQCMVNIDTPGVFPCTKPHEQE